jgi:mannitol/fructose-specific phosphotransferase system IIA component (Ntr-type)
VGKGRLEGTVVKLSEIVQEGAILSPMSATTRDAALGELLSALLAQGAAPGVSAGELMRRVLERENKGSTGFGKGVAVPHVKHPGVTRMSAAIGVSHRGIDFNALDRQPVYSVVLLVSPEDMPEEHLKAMEVIFKNLSKDTFRRFLRQAGTVEDVRGLLLEADGQHFPG